MTVIDFNMHDEMFLLLSAACVHIILSKLSKRRQI